MGFNSLNNEALTNKFPIGKQWKSEVIEINFKAEIFQEKSLTDITAKQYKWINQMIRLFRRDFDWIIFYQDLMFTK